LVDTFLEISGDAIEALKQAFKRTIEKGKNRKDDLVNGEKTTSSYGKSTDRIE